jgi:5-methylcytosine-specific restriction endonuclease McrA
MSQHGARGAAWGPLRKAVLERDSYVCQHCGADATEANRIVPRSMGGMDVMDVMENLVASCKPCSARRGGRALVRSSEVNPRWLDSL